MIPGPKVSLLSNVIVVDGKVHFLSAWTALWQRIDCKQDAAELRVTDTRYAVRLFISLITRNTSILKVVARVAFQCFTVKETDKTRSLTRNWLAVLSSLVQVPWQHIGLHVSWVDSVAGRAAGRVTDWTTGWRTIWIVVSKVATSTLTAQLSSWRTEDCGRAAIGPVAVWLCNDTRLPTFQSLASC